jgi:hypothetical protein
MSYQAIIVFIMSVLAHPLFAATAQQASTNVLTNTIQLLPTAQIGTLPAQATINVPMSPTQPLPAAQPVLTMPVMDALPIVPQQPAITQPAPTLPQVPVNVVTPQLPVQPKSVQKPIEQKPKKFVEEPVDYGRLETIDIEGSGNWLQKRQIWEDAQTLYGKIRDSVQKILDERMNFFEKRGMSDKELNHFYVNISFEQGELDGLLDELLASLAAEQPANLSDEERLYRAKLLEKKNELESLVADVKSITELDAVIDDALRQMIAQINLAVGYEKQAWQRFKDIGQELDDKKAKEHYLHMDIYAKNINAIYGYFNGPLAQYCNTVLQKIAENMSSVTSRIQELKASGIELKKKMNEIEAAEKAEWEQQKKAAEDRAKSKRNSSWSSKIVGMFTDSIEWIRKTWNNLFGGKPKKK